LLTVGVVGAAGAPAGYQGFYDCLAGPEVEVPPACAALHDADGDGDVDLADFAEFQVAYLGEVVIETQLAGNALTVYPFFEYVTAFNVSATVQIGVDPTLLPALVGATTDVYIVADKTLEEWESDPTLTDVRGAPQAITWGGTTVQQNTFRIATANQLSASAGTGVGVGYDLVIDANRNGMLDGGDCVDGYRYRAGFYVVADLVALGPLATTSVTYSGGSWLGQRTWYPTGIASLGELPLVVISHGNGHDYTWYDYLQQHLASYGYVVMSHQNNTSPGIETASTTTLTNTDYFLGHLSTIAGGVLQGHVDEHEIIWIGHSRGGEGVVRAYDRLHDEHYTPANFALRDVLLVCSIAPTDFLGPTQSDPHDVDYFLIYGSADGDVGGYPDNDVADSFNIYERAQGFRQSVYVHGADHNDFNCCGTDDFTGPSGTAIGRPEAQRVAKAAFLALIKHEVEGNVPAKDFLWRQYEDLKPIGVAATTTVILEYKEGAGSLFVDDFQAQSSLAVSSSGGAVTYDVPNPYEGLMNDADGTFTWATSDPMNGMTRARTADTTKGVVFDWASGTTRFLEFGIVPAARDVSGYEYLSLRACQQTRHPQTTAELSDLTFTVSLRDGAGTVSAINIGAYGGGIEEPYQRTGSGTGAGWQNAFETVRLRLTDFQRNGVALDLTDIVAVRLDFGTGFGSSRGRLGFDDLQFSKDRNPGGLTVRAVSVPDYIPPGQPTTLQVAIRARGETYVPGSGYLRYRYDGGQYQALPLTLVSDGVFEATLPPAACGELPEFYFLAEGSISGPVTDPPGAPGSVYSAPVSNWTDFYEQLLDTNPGWTISGGLWAYGQPTGGGGQYGGPDPTSGYSGTNVYGYNLSGDYENSLPERHLTTSAINCTGRTGVRLSFWRWLGVEQPQYDHAYVRVSTNGSTWTTVWQNASEIADTAWTFQAIDISSVADNQPTVYLRWTMGTTDTAWQYCGWNIDDVRLSALQCP